MSKRRRGVSLVPIFGTLSWVSPILGVKLLVIYGEPSAGFIGLASVLLGMVFGCVGLDRKEGFASLAFWGIGINIAGYVLLLMSVAGKI